MRECELYGVEDKEDILKVIREYAMSVVVDCCNVDCNVEINFESEFLFYFCRTVDENCVYDIDGYRIYKNVFMASVLVRMLLMRRDWVC